MSVKIYPYKQASRSTRLLGETLGAKVLKRVGSQYSPRPQDVVVNWGSSTIPSFDPAIVLNSRAYKAQNKLDCFISLDLTAVPLPPFWLFAEDIPEDAYPIVCRTVLNGHSGQGIVIADTSDGLVEASLYVKYIKKKEEYRVHVFHQDVIFVQRKARKLDVLNPDWRVRNLSGGFVFVEAQPENMSSSILDASVGAVHCLGLDFGAVDVIWNEEQQKAYVLEVNTACGLEQRTADKYAQAIRNFAGL